MHTKTLRVMKDKGKKLNDTKKTSYIMTKIPSPNRPSNLTSRVHSPLLLPWEVKKSGKGGEGEI